MKEFEYIKDIYNISLFISGKAKIENGNIIEIFLNHGRTLKNTSVKEKYTYYNYLESIIELKQDILNNIKEL